jgi:uncharacterized protein (TIGR03067 family)
MIESAPGRTSRDRFPGFQKSRHLKRFRNPVLDGSLATMTEIPGILALLVAAATTTGGGDPSELARHQGTWAVVSFVADGKETPREIAHSITRVVEDDHVTWFRDGKAFAGTSITLEPSLEPKGIDVLPDGGPRRGQRVLGIYRLDDDMLTICMAAPDAARPKSFEAGPGSGQTLMRFRRVPKR